MALPMVLCLQIKFNLSYYKDVCVFLLPYIHYTVLSLADSWEMRKTAGPAEKEPRVFSYRGTDKCFKNA
jgi:hypothetical protein